MEWTQQETEYLINNYNKIKTSEIAKHLNRPASKIYEKMKRIRESGTAVDKVPIGTKINRLTVIKRLDTGNSIYECLCECGKTIAVGACRLRCKEGLRIKSCGCHKMFSGMLMDIHVATPEQYSLRALFSGYMRGAQTRGIGWHLTFEEFVEIVKKSCSYCGVEPRTYNAKKGAKKLTPEEIAGYEIKANGVDRLNSKKDYQKGNVTSCCKECNYAKLNMTLSEWNSYLNRIYRYRHKLLQESLHRPQDALQALESR